MRGKAVGFFGSLWAKSCDGHSKRIKTRGEVAQRIVASQQFWLPQKVSAEDARFPNKFAASRGHYSLRTASNEGKEDEKINLVTVYVLVLFSH